MEPLGIHCPKCKKKDHEQPSPVLSYFDSNFKCKYCGYTGNVYASRKKQAAANRSFVERRINRRNVDKSVSIVRAKKAAAVRYGKTA
jgi:hypothetical protein